MAAKLSGSGGGKYTVEANAEINITPFVDIMLVLLIIFMVAAPLATVSVPVTLPRAVAPPAQNPPKPVFIGEDLKGQIGNRTPDQERIFIRGDQQTRYGDFMQVMNALQDNGFYSVALVGEE